MEKELDRLAEIAIESAVAGSAAVLSLVHPAAGIAAATLSPAASHAIERVVDAILVRYRERAGRAVDVAAADSQKTPDEVVERLLGTPGGERILTAGLTAAQHALFEEKLVLIGRALARGVLAQDDAVLEREGLLLAVVGDLEIPHVRVLDVFTKSLNQLGMGDPANTKDDEPVGGLGKATLESAIPGFVGAIQPLVAVLLRHGLLVQMGDGAILGGGTPLDSWIISDFGREVLDRFREAGLKSNR